MKISDPAFDFLLKSSAFDNYFYPVSARSNENDYYCKGCNEIVARWDREDHFNKHKTQQIIFHEAARVAANLNREQGNGETRTDICVQCGGEFTQERKRGRPRVKCFVCQPEKG